MAHKKGMFEDSDIELRVIDSTTEPKTSWYVNDDKNDNFQNKEQNKSGRLPYRQVGKSVFFCYDPNGDETDEPPLCKSDNDVKGPIDAFIIIYQSGLARKTSWEAQVEEAVYNETDEFWKQVTHKTQEMQIKRVDAIMEVFTDRIVKKAKTCDKALLWVSKQDISEFFAEIFVTRLLQRGANTISRDKQHNTSLHYAAKKGWTSVAKTLKEHHDTPALGNKEGLTPLELAIRNDHNECATFLVKSMEPLRVRNLFQGDRKNKCKLNFHALLEKKHMQETTLAVLNTMMQPLEGEPGTYIVYYHILDGDQHGRAPNSPYFDSSEKSCLYKIAKSNNKEVVYHDVVRLFLRRKWNQFARHRFLSQFIFYIFHTVVMTLALVLAARKADPREYDEGVDIFRGICEALLLLCITYNVFVEVYQFRRHKLIYFKDVSNYLDIGAILFPFLIIPFRIAALSVQWVFASIGYFSQTLRGLEFASVFRSTGAYVQILYLILWQDMVPFGAVFSLFLVAFTGAFYFALRGEEITTTVVAATNCTTEIDDKVCTQNFTTVESSSLDVFPHLTEEYYHVLFSNLRVMIEAEDIIDGYFGPNGFKWLSVIIYTMFLFLVITVLLNLLIAQMSDTYANVQSDAQRSLFINRARIVAKVEHSSLFASALFDYRKRNYTNCEVVDNLHSLLDKWEAPPISQVSKEIKHLRDSIKQQETANGQLINEVNNELKQYIEEQKIEKLHESIQQQKAANAQFVDEVRNELKQLQNLIEEKEAANREYRVAVMEALNQQKQLIQELMSRQVNTTEI